MKKISPLDLQPSTAIGIETIFNEKGVFKSTYFTKDALKNNIINFLLTNKNERFLNPTFGGDLNSFLFEQISNNNFESLEEEIKNKLEIYFPSIFIEEFNIYIQNQNSLIINFSYKIKNSSLNDNIQLILNQ